MITNYMKFTAIVELVQNNLTDYLTNYSIYNSSKETCHFTLQGDKAIHLKIDEPIFEFRKHSLKVSRVENVLRTITSIGGLLKKQKQDLNDTDFITALDEIQNLLQSGLLVNNQLTADNGKFHLTYKQSRTAGLGMFDSWIRKTWFQSRASVAYERAIDEFENLTKEILNSQTNRQLN